MSQLLILAWVFVSIVTCRAFPGRGLFPSHLGLNKFKISGSSTALGLTTADFKNGMTLELDGVPCKLLEFLHVKPGKGSAFVRTKIKNLMNGSVQEKTFRAGESVDGADVFKSEMQYTYDDGNNFMFMDMTTFEEVPIEKSKIDNADLMKEGLSCQVSVWNEQVIDVSLPNTVEYTVVETPPNFKGNTAQGGTKPATLDSGAVINVPMFIETGEKIIVSTTGTRPEYMNRASGETKNFNRM